MKKRTRAEIRVEIAVRRCLGLPEPEPGHLMRRLARRHLEEMEARRPRPFCGARTRAGTPCKARVVKKPDGKLSSKCRLHGGRSTGPTSEAGREAIRESNRRRAQIKGKANAST